MTGISVRLLIFCFVIFCVNLIFFLVLWNTYDECKSFALLNGGHKGAILDVQFSAQGDYIFSASTDKNVIIWDAGTCTRIKKLTGHQSIVNSLSTSRDQNKALVCSASDDKTVRIWDTRKRAVVSSFKDDYQLTAVTFNENAEQVIVGGIENVLKVYDLRKNKLLYTMHGHYDTITGLALSPDGNFVLSNSMDNSCKFKCKLFKLLSSYLFVIRFQYASGTLGHSCRQTGTSKP